jgi:hypothetical protein
MRNLLAGLALLASLSTAFAQQLPPFQPVDTKNLAVTASAQNLTLPTALAGTGQVQYVIQTFCSASQLSFYRSDGTAATVNNGMPVGPGVAYVVTLPASITTLSVIGTGTACTFYATVGVGQ